MKDQLYGKSKARIHIWSNTLINVPRKTSVGLAALAYI